MQLFQWFIMFLIILGFQGVAHSGEQDTLTYYVGDTLEVVSTISGVQDFSGLNAKVTYSRDLLRFVKNSVKQGVEIPEGVFMVSDLDTAILVGEGRLGRDLQQVNFRPDSEYVLFTMKFVAKDTGLAVVNYSEVSVYNYNRVKYSNVLQVGDTAFIYKQKNYQIIIRLRFRPQ